MTHLRLHLFLAQPLNPEDGILPAHPSPEGALELGAEGQLVHVVVLLGAELVALGGEALVLEALEAGVPGLDFLGLGVAGCGGGAGDVGGGDGRGEGGCGAVGRKAGGCAVAGGLFGMV